MSPSRLLRNPLLYAILFGLLLTGYTVRVAIERRGGGPPELGEVPPFTLLSQGGQSFGRDELRGKVWVANFVFTRCPTVCPLFTAKMREVQQRLPEGKVQLVSFSVDPEHDTPERLSAFAHKHHARLSNWVFLTGELRAIKAAVTDGLKVGFGRDPRSEDVNGVFHGTHFVLGDGEGKIRGYYLMDEPGAIDRLVKDAHRLLP